MKSWDEIRGVNWGYALDLYERFLHDPESVDEETRKFFQQGPPPDAQAEGALSLAQSDKIVAAVNLAESIRKFGHMDARLDPLGAPPPGDPSLRMEFHGVSEADLRNLPGRLFRGPIGQGSRTMDEVIQTLRRVYCGSIGYDFAHLRDPEEREWLRVAVENGLYRAPADPVDAPALLERLTQVETFERFLHRTFPGKTRFSVEGLDMLLPILDEMIGAAAEAGIRHILIGMAHRARLNVLAHILGKPYAQILAEFKDPVRARKFREDAGWTGDVKYHLGARRAIPGGREVEMIVSLPPNPSHLEAADPVVEGMARAAGTLVDRPGPPRFDPTVTLPLLIHGDAAFAGQGVVTETLNFYRLRGYTTGGTVHIIADNQLGYTADPDQYRSALFASGVARGFRIPIVHVNADDPEACVEVARLAFAYRSRFEKDFLIDLVGYRRHGHNEGDEPAFTQPLLYEKIARHPTAREIWARTLIERGEIVPQRPQELVEKRLEELESALKSLRPEEELVESIPEPPPHGAARQARTAVPAQRLRELNEALLQLPADFHIHRKLERARARRRQALDDLDAPTLDWSTAEELALASILADGIAIRMTGQDVERGTFSQRHAVFHDVQTGALFIPLQAFPQAKAAFEIHNSPLSENAAVGFEYGYSMQAPNRLVIWEAQYGDFINGAQTVIDEFVVSARAKWGQSPSLVLLLPHGHEGQGPDHSSARPERFLQLAAEINLRVANCTSAAQYFHLLRMQASLLEVDPLPLVVLTPKSLLRHPLVFSSLRELAEGSWQRVMDDAEARRRASEVRRMILSSGKVHVDLASSPERPAHPEVALVRLEQLYPFPENELKAVLESYPQLQEVTWAQEEPENMGAWEHLRPQLERLFAGRWRLRYTGRQRSSSPAEGSSARHALNQEEIVHQAYNPQLESHQEDMVLVKKG
jgi:2-oxoglutarate dehydrogenase E1 component